MKKLFTFLRKDYGVLKVLFTMLCIFMIFNDLYIVVFERPTLTTQITQPLQLDDFREFTFCPLPSTDLDQLEVEGFNGVVNYKLGLDRKKNDSTVGWVGNKTKDVSELLIKLSTLKSEEDCPRVTLVYHEDFGSATNYKETMRLANFTLSQQLFPEIICCRMIRPKLEDAVVINALIVRIPTIINFKVMMADTRISSVFTTHKGRVHLLSLIPDCNLALRIQLYVRKGVSK